MPSRIALRAACVLAATVLAGCGPSISTHYVQSARARMVAPTPVPPVNGSTGKMLALAGVRVSQSSDGAGTVRTPNRGTPGEIDQAYVSYPGNYALERDPITLGLEYQAAFNERFDIFLSFEGTPSSAQRMAMIAGMGATVPFPWLNVRFAPALGTHAYRMTVVDSIRTEWLYYSDPDTVRVDRSDAHRIGLLPAISVSAWVPRARTGTPLSPFAQFQWSRLDMRSPTLPSEVLGVQAWVFGGGADFETEWGHVRGRISREAVGARGHSVFWRADLGLHARLSAKK